MAFILSMCCTDWQAGSPFAVLLVLLEPWAANLCNMANAFLERRWLTLYWLCYIQNRAKTKQFIHDLSSTASVQASKAPGTDLLHKLVQASLLPASSHRNAKWRTLPPGHRKGPCPPCTAKHAPGNEGC